MKGYDSWLEKPYQDAIEAEEERDRLIELASQDSSNTDLMREAIIQALENPKMSGWVRDIYMDLSSAREVDKTDDVLIQNQIDKQNEV